MDSRTSRQVGAYSIDYCVTTLSVMATGRQKNSTDILDITAWKVLFSLDSLLDNQMTKNCVQ